MFWGLVIDIFSEATTQATISSYVHDASFRNRLAVVTSYILLACWNPASYSQNYIDNVGSFEHSYI